MRINVFFALVMLVSGASPSAAADLPGSWEGQYFCKAPNAVGQLKLRIVKEGDRLVGHESYARGSNSGTVVYRVEQQASDQFRLVLDRDRTRDFDYTYHLDYRIFPDRSLSGRYVGHRNCQATNLKSTSPSSPTAEASATAPKRTDQQLPALAPTAKQATTVDASNQPLACDDNSVRFRWLNPYQRASPHIEFLLEPARAAALVSLCDAAEKNAAGKQANPFGRRKYAAMYAAGRRDEAVQGLIALRDAGDRKVASTLGALYYGIYLAERQARQQAKAIGAYKASLDNYQRAASLNQSQPLPQGDLIAPYLAYIYSGGPYRFDPETAQFGDPARAMEFGNRAIAHVSPEVTVAMAHLLDIYTYDHRTKYAPELIAQAKKSRIAWLQRAAASGNQLAQSELKSIVDTEAQATRSKIAQQNALKRKEEDRLFLRTHRETSNRNGCIKRERGTIFSTLTLRNTCNETLTVNVCKRSVAGVMMRELANAWQMGQLHCETKTVLPGYSIDTIYVPNVDNILASMTFGSDDFTAFACSASAIMGNGACWVPGKPVMMAVSDFVIENWKALSMGLLLFVALGAGRLRKRSV